MKTILFGIAGWSLVLIGCATVESKVAPRVAQAVSTYCTQPQDQRIIIRGQLNAMAAPNSIKVTCEGDTE